MSYTDVVTVFSYADPDAYDMAQEWLDDISEREAWKRLCAVIRILGCAA